MSQKVFFADLTHCGTVANADTFPLGMGCIAAYAKKQFGDDLEAEIFKFPDELNDALLAGAPDVMCFSNYSWNANLSKAFARYVRETYPSTAIVMGGPNISISTAGRREFLAQNPFVDFYVKFEGEYAFSDLLRRLREYGFDASELRASKVVLDNILYLTGDEYIEGPERRVTDYMAVPSPYVSGLMDKFFDQGLRPLVEFTRGCPYACTFCTDSHAHRSKIYRKTAKFVADELDYIARHMKHPSDLIFADLNFGMYKEDIEFAKITRSIIDRYDWPRTITTSPGKSHPDRVMEATKIINGDDKGVIKFAASLQSTDDEVLAAICRKNLPLDKIRPAVETANTGEDYTEYFSELILALPEDSKQKHYRSLKDAVDRLQMNTVNVHQLTILEGSPMALHHQKEQYGFVSKFRVFVGCIGTYQIGLESVPVAEIEEVVVANKTITHAEWLECRVMSLLVKIYIDRDYFIEIFGLIRRLNLSPIDLLEHLRCGFIHKYEGFQALCDLFLEKTVEPLHDSLEIANEFIGDPEVVAKFESGDLGGNELLIHRAMAYLDHNDDIHSALGDTAVSYLEQNGFPGDDMREYVTEAVAFSRLRKFNPRNYQSDLEGTFQFDFVGARDKGFQVLPEDVQIEPRPVRFYFNETAKSEIDYALRTWILREGTHRGNGKSGEITDLAEIRFDENAHTKFSFGKLFHYSNLRVMNRSAAYVETATPPEIPLGALPRPDPTPSRAAYNRERYLALVASPKKLWNYVKYAATAGGSANVSYLPIKLDIENVSRCNFRCTMCRVSEWDKGKRSTDMSFKDFRRLIDEQTGLVEIKVQGMGEPLLQGEEYLKMIRYARSKHIWVGTATNASLLHLNASLAQRLVGKGKRLGVDVRFWNIAERYRRGAKEAMCPWPFERSYASSDGRVVPCCIVSNPDTFELNGGQTLKEVWQNDEYLDFRQAHLDGEIPDICSQCYETRNDSLNAGVPGHLEQLS